MNTLLNNEHADHQAPASSREQYARNDREISLGTATILGIFFALAVVCAVFFGFGYSLGVKHIMATAAPPAEPSQTSAFSAFKPAPGSPVAAGKPPATLAAVTVPSTVPTPKAPTPSETLTPEPTDSSPRVTIRTPAPAATPATAPAAPLGSATAIVQVAAVSHQEDADLIASTLKRRGYAVTIRHESQDTLLHLQLGPFPTKKDAEAMRQRLQADGFNAYIK